jgi:PleD family two-component response regulator
MHRPATMLLTADRNRVPISMADYERFGTALKRMRLEVLTLKRELEDALYNLDPLTGTASRIGMLTKLREQQELVKRKVHGCCIAMIDPDVPVEQSIDRADKALDTAKASGRDRTVIWAASMTSAAPVQA